MAVSEGGMIRLETLIELKLIAADWRPTVGMSSPTPLVLSIRTLFNVDHESVIIANDASLASTIEQSENEDAGEPNALSRTAERTPLFRQLDATGCASVVQTRLATRSECLSLFPFEAAASLASASASPKVNKNSMYNKMH